MQADCGSDLDKLCYSKISHPKRGSVQYFFVFLNGRIIAKARSEQDLIWKGALALISPVDMN